MQLIGLTEIKKVLSEIDLIAEIEAGFAAYSAGRVVVPPVGELIFDEPPGDVHIKYGYIRGDDYYVIKVASGFPENRKAGLPSSNGMMLLFDQKTGKPVAVLADEGHLTDVRTAVAGAIAAKHLAPTRVHRIGIVGAGTQARLQLEALRGVVECSDVLVAGRSTERLAQYQAEMSVKGFTVATTTTADEVASSCDLIVTTTPSTRPLIRLAALNRSRGLHVTAMGSDTAHKQEIDADVLAAADVVVTDSVSQAMARGEVFQALAAGKIQKEAVVELGQIVRGVQSGRTDDAQLTVADLTGVAVQDINVAKAVYQRLASR